MLSSHPTLVRCDIEKWFITCSATLTAGMQFWCWHVSVFPYLIPLLLYIYICVYVCVCVCFSNKKIIKIIKIIKKRFMLNSFLICKRVLREHPQLLVQRFHAIQNESSRADRRTMWIIKDSIEITKLKFDSNNISLYQLAKPLYLFLSRYVLHIYIMENFYFTLLV